MTGPTERLEGIPDSSIERYEPAPWEAAFFEAYLAKYGVIATAAAEAGVSSTVVRNRMRSSRVFAAKMQAAKESVDGLLEFRALSLAIDGFETPVFHRGELVQTIRSYDTRHIEWMLERRMPERYHLPEVVRLEGADGAPVRFSFSMGEEPVEGEAIEDAELDELEPPSE